MDLIPRGPYANDVYVPPATLPWLPRGGWLSLTAEQVYRYISLCDEDHIERALEAWVIDPDGGAWRVRQGVEYGEGDPADSSTERIPQSLESEVDSLGPLRLDELDELIYDTHPDLRR